MPFPTDARDTAVGFFLTICALLAVVCIIFAADVGISWMRHQSTEAECIASQCSTLCSQTSTSDKRDPVRLYHCMSCVEACHESSDAPVS